MVGAGDPLVPRVAIGPDTGRHVVLAVVVEGLVELLRRAPDVAEMDEVDLLLLAEMANDARQVVGHEAEVALTEADAVCRAGNEIDHLLVVLNAADNAGDALDRRQGRVIGMHGELDVRLFGDRDNALEEVFQVVPLVLLGDFAMLACRVGLVELLEVKAGHLGTAARRDFGRRANHEEGRHPRRAPYRDADRPHVADELADDGDLFVASRLGQLDLFHGWTAFNDR